MQSSLVTDTSGWTIPSLVQDIAGFLSGRPSEAPLEPVPTNEAPPPSPSPVSTHEPPTECSAPDVQPCRHRPRTKYLLAQPPPTTKSQRRLSARPRVVLQLQNVENQKRPMPAFEIVPTNGSASQLMRTFSTLGKTERSAPLEGLALVPSEQYSPVTEKEPGNRGSVDDDKTAGRGQRGKIMFARTGKDLFPHHDEISLENGLTWEAYRLRPSVYEFSGKNHNGLRLRWLARRDPKKPGGSLPETDLDAPPQRFSFSIINPNARRHPVIATVSRKNILTIWDQFPSAISPAASPVTSPTASPPISPGWSATSSPASFLPPAAFAPVSSHTEQEFPFIDTGDDLRSLIILTAVWVMSQEGWLPRWSRRPSSTARMTDEVLFKCPSSMCSSEESFKGPQSRRQSFTMHRPSTAPFSQGPARWSVSCPRGLSEQEQMTVGGTAPQLARRSISMLPREVLILNSHTEDKIDSSAAEESRQDHYEQSKPTELAPDQPPTEKSGETKDTKSKKRPGTTRSTAQHVRQKLLGACSTSESDGLLKKRGKLGTACKSLTAPCFGRL